MKVGVYVDAFNLYYGGRGHCGRGAAGWRWLDIRGMVTPLIGWTGAIVDRIAYCTARIDQADSPSSRLDQDIYIAALQHSGSVSLVEEGRYVSWAKASPLTASRQPGPHPALYHVTGSETLDPALPLVVAHDPNAGHDVVLAMTRRREEKGSDVNVAAHLLRDVLTGAVDGAVVVTNDSDLGLPLTMARQVVPVGTVNPQTGYLAGALRGLPTDGVGRHWWRQLSAQDFRSHQLPDPVGPFRKPVGW